MHTTKIIFILLSYTSASLYSMEDILFQSIVHTSSSHAHNSTKQVWLTTTDKKTAPINYQHAKESTPLKLLVKNFNSGTQERPIHVNFSGEDINTFTHALNSPTNSDTLDIALHFKAPGLYARCIHEQLPQKCDETIFHYYFSAGNKYTAKLVATLDLVQKCLSHYPKHHKHRIHSITSSPHKSHCIIAQDSMYASFVYELWNTKNKTCIKHFLDNNLSLNDPLFSPCNGYLVHNEMVCDTNLPLTFLKTYRNNLILYNLDQHTTTTLDTTNNSKKTKISPNGHYIAAYNWLCSNDFTLWHINDQKIATKLPEMISLYGTKACIAFHPNDTHMFVVYPDDHKIMLFDLSTPHKEPITIASGYKTHILGLIISEDGSHMMATCNENLKRLFNISNLANIIDITGNVKQAIIDYDGKNILKSLEWYRTPQKLSAKMHNARFIPFTTFIAYSQFFSDRKPCFQLRLFNTLTHEITLYTIPFDITSTIRFDQKNNRIIAQTDNVLYCINHTDLIDPVDPTVKEQKRNVDIKSITLQEQSRLKDISVNKQGLLLCNHAQAIVICDAQGNEISRLNATDKEA